MWRQAMGAVGRWQATTAAYMNVSGGTRPHQGDFLSRERTAALPCSCLAVLAKIAKGVLFDPHDSLLPQRNLDSDCDRTLEGVPERAAIRFMEPLRRL